MRDIDDKIIRLYYKLGSLKQSLPSDSFMLSEEYIKKYNSIVDELEKVINSELSKFKILDDEIISDNPETNEISYSNFMRKLDALLSYIQINKLSPEKRTIGIKSNDDYGKQLRSPSNRWSNRLMGIFRRRFTITDAATLMVEILLKTERNVFVDGIFKLPDNTLLATGYSKEKMIVELSLFDDFCLFCHLPNEALRLKKKELAGRIWNEYCAILKRRMGEAAYNDFVAKSTQRREVYSKIFGLERWISSLPWVFWGYVLDETPRYLAESFDVNNRPDLSATEQLNTYLNRSEIALFHTCRDILKKTQS